MTLRYSTDIVIFGGGIAGLWLLNRLRQQGFAAVLFEANRLGNGQTIASQGIIHGGLKYALSGSLAGAANAIAAMPDRWRRCLKGEGDIDLSGVKVLSAHYYMWSDSSFRSKLKTFLGSRSLRGRVSMLDKADYPPGFAEASVQGTLYELPDIVIDTESLLRELAAKQQDSIFRLDSDAFSFNRDEAGNIAGVDFRLGDESLHIDTQRIIFTAGEGNKELIDKAGLTSAKTQVRPLNMVYLKKGDLPLLYTHCIGDDFSLTPRLTVTSHRADDGDNVWYLGGELAESGVGKSDDDQIAAAKALTIRLFPWIETDGAHWHCFTINRAEANIDNNYRPDDACFVAEQNVMVAWPTKLTLCPSLADKLLERLEQEGVSPGDSDLCSGLSEKMSRPGLARARWD